MTEDEVMSEQVITVNLDGMHGLPDDGDPRLRLARRFKWGDREVEEWIADFSSEGRPMLRMLWCRVPMGQLVIGGYENPLVSMDYPTDAPAEVVVGIREEIGRAFDAYWREPRRYVLKRPEAGS
jgi:hypothetical protein